MSWDLPESLLDEIRSLDEDAKEELARALREMIAEEAAGAGGDPARCPRCGCEHVVRKGTDAAGRQRWLCRGCGRTFGAATMGVLGMSKLPLATWLDYADGMAQGLTLRQLAERCGVCLKTSWFMRMRVCEAMGTHLDRFRSGEGVYAEVDGTMLRESFAGNNNMGQFSLPRKKHRNGNSLHVRGVSGQQVCVLCAANDRGDVLARLMGRAHGTSRAILASLGDSIARGTHVATDGLAQYEGVMEELGCAHEVRPSGHVRGKGALGMVNAVHARLKAFLRGFKGVATRRLQRYLDWYCWTEQFRGGLADRGDLVAREATTGTYEATIRDIFLEDRFDMGYWVSAV